MSIKILYAAAAVLAMATPALAQETSPWDLRDRNAYVLDMQGKMWSTRASGKGWAPPARHSTAITWAQIAIMLTNRPSDVRAATSSMAERSIVSSSRT